MELVLKNKVISLLIVVLLLTNAASLLTLWILHFKKAESSHQVMILDQDAPGAGGSVRDIFVDRFHFSAGKLDSSARLHDLHFTESKTIRDTILTLKRELNKLVTTPSPNRQEISRISRAIGSQHARLESLNTDHFHRLWLLTDEKNRPEFEHFLNRIQDRMAPGGMMEKRVMIRKVEGSDPQELIWIDGKPVQPGDVQPEP